MSNSAAVRTDGETLLSPDQLAEWAGVSVATIRRLIAGGELPAVKVSRLVRVRLADWHGYLEQHRAPRRSDTGASARWGLNLPG